MKEELYVKQALCGSWYPKKPRPELADEFENLEIICNVRIDTVLYDLPGERTRSGRPRIRGQRTGIKSIHLEKSEGADYFPLPTISKWLSHSNMETTRCYAKVIEDMKR